MTKTTIALQDMTPDQHEHEKGLVALGESRHTLEDVQAAIDAHTLNVGALQAAEKITANRAADAEAIRKAQEFRDSAQAAFDAEKVLDALSAKEEATADLLGQQHKETIAAANRVAELVESALEKTAEGDRSFMLADHALLQRLKFAGVPVRGITTGPEQPSVSAALKQAVHNFLGQLRIEMRKRGEPVPK
jgi:hypothetical protein